MASLSPRGMSPTLSRISTCAVTDISLCRNIYYKDPALFKDQSTVDRYVDILAYTFGVPRAALNVVRMP